MKHTIFAALLAVLPGLPALAGQTNVAVAANFTEPATEIAKLFEEHTGHKAILSFGATGQFYTQITQGAPFEVFLAADNIRPEKAVTEGYGVAGTVFTYAIGQLVLWSKDPHLVTGPEVLKSDAFHKIAIADPQTAPYGLAAVQTMTALGVEEALRPKIVQGTSIGQTLQFVETANAELGFVALSQVIAKDEGSRWIVPASEHEPILQDAVLLKTGEANEAARAFLDFLKGPEATAVIEKFGYALAKDGVPAN